MTIEQWVEENVKPNVLAINKITTLADAGSVTKYDISVLVDKGNGIANIETQPVIESGGKFYFGRGIVKNFEKPAEAGKSIEAELIEHLDTTYGEGNYKICPPIDTPSGKAGVIEVNGSKFVVAKIGGEIVARAFGG